MSYDPICHVSAIGTACYAYSFCIYIGMLFQYQISKVHDIFIIDCAVFSSDICKLIASSVTSPGITEEHGITGSGPYLHLMEENIPVYGFGTTMNVQNGRIFFF